MASRQESDPYWRALGLWHGMGNNTNPEEIYQRLRQDEAFRSYSDAQLRTSVRTAWNAGYNIDPLEEWTPTTRIVDFRRLHNPNLTRGRAQIRIVVQRRDASGDLFGAPFEVVLGASDTERITPSWTRDMIIRRIVADSQLYVNREGKRYRAVEPGDSFRVVGMFYNQ